MSRRGAGSQWLTAGFLAGVVTGVVVWSLQIRRSRRALFAASPLRRLAALGHLAGRPSIESVRLLTEYLRWETRPMLRRRGERILGRMQRHLG